MTEPLDSVDPDEGDEFFDEEEFTEEESQQFRKLIEIGELSSTLEVLGHDIVVRTLNSGEEMQLGLLVKDFQGSPSFQRAWRTALVAAVVVSVDGEPVYFSIDARETSTVALTKRFEKWKGYKPPVIDAIYEAYQRFEIEELAPTLSRLGKSQG